jgi:HK97 family phage prohead protease
MELMQELINAVNNQAEYKFTTDTLTFSTTELKGEKQAYVTGYISVPEVDLYNDLVTMHAMKSLLKQIKESTITVDYEHEAWRDDNSILPVAKIVEAKVDDRGLWVKCLLNKNSPKYKALWGSIKDGFINAFSIAFQPLVTVEKSMGGVTVRLIEELKLLNVAFTGAPVNKGAILTEFGMKSVMLKAIEDSEIMGEQVVVPKKLLSKLMEEKNMVEETKVEEVPEVTESESEIKETEEPVVEETQVEESEVEEKALEEQKNSQLISELKAMLEEQKKTIEKQGQDLKSLKSREVFKSPTVIEPEIKSVLKQIDMLGLI